MLELADAWAKRYGQRPSDLLHSDPFDVAFDVLCMQAGRTKAVRWAHTNKAMAVASED